MRRIRLAAALTGLALLLGACASQPAAPSPTATPGLLPAGTRAPSFSLPTANGQTLSLAAFAGKPVIVEFLATW